MKEIKKLVNIIKKLNSIPRKISFLIEEKVKIKRYTVKLKNTVKNNCSSTLPPIKVFYEKHYTKFNLLSAPEGI